MRDWIRRFLLFTGLCSLMVAGVFGFVYLSFFTPLLLAPLIIVGCGAAYASCPNIGGGCAI